MTRLERIRAAVEASRKASDGAGVYVSGPQDWYTARQLDIDGPVTWDDCEHIAAHSPAAMSALLAEVEALADAHERALRVVECAREAIDYAVNVTPLQRYRAGSRLRAALDAFDGAKAKP